MPSGKRKPVAPSLVNKIILDPHRNRTVAGELVRFLKQELGEINNKGMKHASIVQDLCTRTPLGIKVNLTQ
jgi:hypothetical protein